jgi:hypothetical protein
LSEAALNDNFVDVPLSRNRQLYKLHSRASGRGASSTSLDLTAIYNHPCGFFAEGEALWSAPK